MSLTTWTWPSQKGPAPMPMVGTLIFWVMILASGVGTASRTTAKAPASSRAHGVLHQADG